ncbi:MAG: rod shape-determining protein MreD [Bacteroidia bacterium]|jgi:rod shape-determining protein MreD|uniref:Rod shape-determining protein MreD n=1 Tax=Flavobacterium algoritolerans TaxID=3041254 RepID=A0ABT6VAI8_9FLAO|nr:MULTISPECIES: rod shape-determining protein MreD [Flavobacterium]MBP6757463.1 rod shape-determining protein MreD [Bacteroidia bacterium]MDI5888899.1 rod shape-determining protein MreD [Flavobacterium yafengii]MDI5895257.1 rod shape-determining protein MreD [Flavobacterium algoritolerans]MDI6049902.1 rod shape-determining protein MreD [Flavobacterium sp. XS2P24]MDP3679363.1 rod shape-determining protein MreD [Flavobacterium sp.]
MNSALLVNIFRFILLLAVQIIIFNNMNFLGYISPFPYILFIILYPVNGNKSGLVVASFILGLIMDMFSNSGGIHATACLVLAYFRPAIFKFAFGLSYEYQTVKLNDVLTPERFSFILLSVVIHHFTLFLLEAFQFSFIFDILIRTLLSTVFTIIICIIIIYLIKPNKR